MSQFFSTLSLENDAYVDFNISENNVSNALENTNLFKVRLGKIRGMKVFNFKSFEGEHYVGPFTKFTSIIGPNGGGKSNVLDAIQFLFGISIRSMRCQRPEELIYSQSMYYKNFQEESKSAFVEIIFDAINYIETQIPLKRVVNKQMQSQVFIGDQQVSEKEFSQFLLLSKIILPAKNFIMLQGDADTLTTIEPKKLTELFEFVSGSVQYKTQCSQIQVELNKVILRLRELQFQRGSMRTEQKKVKEIKNTSEKYKKLNDEINSLKLKQKLFELKFLDDQINDIHKQISQNKIDESQQQTDNQTLIENIQQCEKEIDQQRQEFNQLIENEKKIQKAEKSKVYDTTQIDLEIELFKKQISTYEGLAKKSEKDINYQLEMLEEIQTEIDSKSSYLQKIQNQTKLNLSKKVLEEFQEIQLNFTTQNQQLQSELQKIQESQNISQKIYDQVDDEIKQYQEDNNQLQSGIEEEKIQIKYIQDELDVIKDKHQNSVKRIEELTQQNRIEENELKQLTIQKNDQEKYLRLLEVLETENIEEKQTLLLIQQLKTMFKDFRGELSSLCNPDQQQFAVALKVAFGQRILCALVVDTEKTAKDINIHLRSLDIVKEIIILNRVKNTKDESELRETVEQYISDYRRKTRTGKAYLAVDILKFDACMEKVVRSLLNGVIICDSYQLAVDLQKQQMKDVKQIITLEGITFSSSGMLVFNGSQQRLGEMRNFRSNNQRMQQKSQGQSKEQLIKSINDLQNKIKLLRNMSVQDDLKYQAALKIKLEEQQVQLSNKYLKHQKQIEIYLEKQRKVTMLIKELSVELEKRQGELKKMETEIEKILKQIQNQQSMAFKDFAKKHQLSVQDLNQLDSQQNFSKQFELKQQQLHKLQLSKQSLEQYVIELKNKESELHNTIKLKHETIQKFEDRKQEILRAQSNKNTELNTFSKHQQEIQAKLKNLQKKLNQLNDQRNLLVKKGVDKKQQYHLNIRKLDQLRFQKSRLIELCEIESIPVRQKKSQATFQPSLNFDDENKIEQEQIDYDAIKEELKKQNYDKILESIGQQLEIKEQEISKYLSENLQIGLIGAKTDQKYIQLENGIESLGKSIKELQTKENELIQELAKTQEMRKDRFNKLFERVDKELKLIYQKLTENINKVGGTVVLYLENREEPFEGGLIYTPNPPNKKFIFDNSEQLSGGEKALASLAMLLSLNAAIDAPFLLLDEVDANLDQENAEKFQKIIKLLSNQIQFILVSHNPDVFSNSDSLVGVTIQHQKTTSEAFSLLL